MQLTSYLKLVGIVPSRFALQIGVPASTISRILRGERVPTLATIERIRVATDGAVTAADYAIHRKGRVSA